MKQNGRPKSCPFSEAHQWTPIHPPSTANSLQAEPLETRSESHCTLRKQTVFVTPLLVLSSKAGTAHFFKNCIQILRIRSFYVVPCSTSASSNLVEVMGIPGIALKQNRAHRCHPSSQLSQEAPRRLASLRWRLCIRAASGVV